DALRSFAAREAAPHEARSRLVPTGHVVLVGVEAVALAVGREASAHVVDSGAGFALADADAEEALAGSGEREPAILERGTAEVLDGPWRPVVDELSENRARDVHPGKLFERDRGLDVAHSHAAVLLADGDAEQVGFAQGIPGGVGELLGLVPVTGVRGELPLGDVARELSQRLLVFVLRERVDTRSVR